MGDGEAKVSLTKERDFTSKKKKNQGARSLSPNYTRKHKLLPTQGALEVDPFSDSQMRTQPGCHLNENHERPSP